MALFFSNCPKGNSVSLRETRKNNAGVDPLLLSSLVEKIYFVTMSQQKDNFLSKIVFFYYIFKIG